MSRVANERRAYESVKWPAQVNTLTKVNRFIFFIYLIKRMIAISFSSF